MLGVVAVSGAVTGRTKVSETGEWREAERYVLPSRSQLTQCSSGLREYGDSGSLYLGFIPLIYRYFKS